MIDFTQLSIAQVIAFVLPIVVPFVAAFITKRAASGQFKSVVLFALSCISGAVSTVLLNDGERWQAYVLAILYSAAIAFVTHYTGVSDTVERKTASFGLGKPAYTEGPPTMIQETKPFVPRWMGDTPGAP